MGNHEGIADVFWDPTFLSLLQVVIDLLFVPLKTRSELLLLFTSHLTEAAASTESTRLRDLLHKELTVVRLWLSSFAKAETAPECPTATLLIHPLVVRGKDCIILAIHLSIHGLTSL